MHAHEQREPTLEFRQRPESPRERTGDHGLAALDRIPVGRRRANAQPLERQQQHAEAAELPHDVSRHRPARAVHRVEGPEPERDRIHAVDALIHVVLARRRDEPCRIDLRLFAGRSLAGERDVGVHLERPCPEGTVGGREGRPGRFQRHAHQQDRQVAERPRERMLEHPPLAIPVNARVEQRLEALRPLRTVRHPEAEGERSRRCFG